MRMWARSKGRNGLVDRIRDSSADRTTTDRSSVSLRDRDATGSCKNPLSLAAEVQPINVTFVICGAAVLIEYSSIRHADWRNTLSFTFSTLLARCTSPERCVRLLDALIPTCNEAAIGLALVVAESSKSCSATAFG